MKKFLKIASLMTLVCLLVSSLSGCYAVDAMRQSRATYDAEGNILWNGAVYKRLSYHEDFCLDTGYDNDVYVADEDVPLLLLSVYGEEILSVDKEKLILEHRQFIEADRYASVPIFYCREDRFEEFEKKILEGFPVEVVCYNYGYYNDETFEYEDKRYDLTEEQISAIRKVLETVEAQKMSEGWYLDYEWQVVLYECTADMRFQRYAMDICLAGSTYYLRVEGDRVTYFYQVPEEYAKEVSQIMEEYLTANDAYNEVSLLVGIKNGMI